MTVKNSIAGYELLKDEKLTDLKSSGLLYRHKKSGARVVVLSNDDNNKVFSIGFRTPPTDCTGVPHIIEHSVLCGSKKFPAKDPFVELAKGSLNTFLNAMTFSDKTIYPVASCNNKDFQNLIHVYLDAVFYPNIYSKKEIFLQEGWHYELENPDDDLTYNGVVYNEMKGVFSSPEQQMGRMIQQSLFPDTAYGTESGGDPDYIPDLSYEDFLDFHKKYYHPSNSYIYLYGDMDVEEKLTWIDQEYLNHFSYAPINSEIELQKPFEKLHEVTGAYSIAENEDTEGKTFFSYNVVVDTCLNQELNIAFQVLDYVLLSAPGAPLKQALIDAGIGDDIYGSYDNGILQPVFEIIAKNVKTEQKEDFLTIIKETLTKISERGIDKKSLLAGINYYEFKYREADFGRYPKGLIYGIKILESWLYNDEEPFLHVSANSIFKQLKRNIGTGYYKELVYKYLLDNTHASFVKVEPKKGLTGKMEKKQKKALAEYKETLSEEQLEQLVKQTRKLREFQETPPTKEELKEIPMLGRDDIGKKAQPLYNEVKKIGGVPVLFHEIVTNEIVYMDLAFDVTDLKEMAPYLSLLSIVLGYIDTKHYSFQELSNEINIHTGGIWTNVSTFSNKKDTNNFCMKFEIGVKVLYDSFSKAWELFDEILQGSKLEDTKRLKEILAETKSRLQMKLLSSGHSTVVARGLSYSSDSSFVQEQMNGIAFYRFIEYLNDHFEEEKDRLIDIFKKMMHKIFRREKMMVNFTADKKGYELLANSLEGFTYTLSTRRVEIPELPAFCKTKKEALNEGFKTSGKVQFVARTGNFLREGFPYTGTLRVIKTILSYDYLWLNIRVKGGAYGVMCGFAFDGNGYFTSYRDPNLAQTNEIYEHAAKYLENFSDDEMGITKYIIGTISEMDIPLNPSAKGRRSYSAYLSGITQEDIQREREEVLSTTLEKIRQTADAVRAVLSAGDICVIGSEGKIEQDNGLFKTIDALN